MPSQSPRASTPSACTSHALADTYPDVFHLVYTVSDRHVKLRRDAMRWAWPLHAYQRSRPRKFYPRKYVFYQIRENFPLYSILINVTVVGGLVRYWNSLSAHRELATGAQPRPFSGGEQLPRSPQSARTRVPAFDELLLWARGAWSAVHGGLTRWGCPSTNLSPDGRRTRRRGRRTRGVEPATSHGSFSGEGVWWAICFKIRDVLL